MFFGEISEQKRNRLFKAKHSLTIEVGLCFFLLIFEIFFAVELIKRFNLFNQSVVFLVFRRTIFNGPFEIVS